MYDLLYQDITDDIQMYIKLLIKCNSILEFGAGTGRVTIPLARSGKKIDAVDIEQKMLDELVMKISVDNLLRLRIKPILANMCGYKTSKKFDAVIIPLTSFNYLLSQEEQLLCLESVYNALKEKGFAIIELLSKKTFNDVNSNDELSFVKRIDLGDNAYYDYYRKTRLDLASRTIIQNRVFQLFRNEKLTNEENLIWINRFVTAEDFIHLAKMANLDVCEIYGNCNLEKYNEDSEDIFVKVRRKDENRRK